MLTLECLKLAHVNSIVLSSACLCVLEICSLPPPISMFYPPPPFPILLSEALELQQHDLIPRALVSAGGVHRKRCENMSGPARPFSLSVVFLSRSADKPGFVFHLALANCCVNRARFSAR